MAQHMQKVTMCLLNMFVKSMCLMTLNTYLNSFQADDIHQLEVDKNMMRLDETNMRSLVEGAIVLSFFWRCHEHDHASMYAWTYRYIYIFHISSNVAI